MSDVNSKGVGSAGDDFQLMHGMSGALVISLSQGVKGMPVTSQYANRRELACRARLETDVGSLSDPTDDTGMLSLDFPS